jgi:hypothetical protein
MITVQSSLIGIMFVCTPSALFVALMLWRDQQDQKEDRRRGFGPD